MPELPQEARSLARLDRGLRSLARSLVADEPAAEDLAQADRLLAGTVLMPDGSPAEPATLLARLLAPPDAPGLLLANFAEHRYERAVRARAGDGVARLADLPPGRYVLHALFEGAGLIELGELELAPGETRDLYELEPPAREPVRIAAVDAELLPGPGASLQAAYLVDELRCQVPVTALELARETSLELLPGEYCGELARASSVLRPDFEVWPAEPLALELSARIAAAEED